jgi:phage terminase large subunit-like protein
MEIPADIKKELTYRATYEKYRYYKPIGKVENFLDKLLTGEYMVGALLAANGVGKTTAMVNTLAHLMFPCGNKYFQQPLMKDWYFPKKGRIVSDPTTIRETIAPALEQWFPHGKYMMLNKGKNYPASWTTETGWEFDLMTYDQSVKEFESSTLGFVFFDEPPPEAIFKASIARLRLGGICGIFATPLMGSAWLYDEIVANPRAGEQFRFHMEAEVEDACKIHGVRGFLDHGKIEKMVAQYKDEDMVARVFGKFQHLVGLIFKEFERGVHVLEPFELNQEDYCVYVSWDTHPREPEMIVWVAVDRKGRCIVVDELYSDAPTEELVARIKQIDSKYRVVRRLMDPAGFIEDKRTGDSFAGLLSREYGLNFEPASKRRTDAIRMMKDAFHYEIAGGDMIIKPMLLTFSTAERFIWEVLHWQWQEYTGKTAEKRSKNPRPEDKNDHAIEAVGRVLLERPVFIEKPLNLKGESGNTFEQSINLDPFN